MRDSTLTIGLVSRLTLLAVCAPAVLAAPPACPGDANGDFTVTFADITASLANWGNNYLPGTGPGDSNGDGLVTFADITESLANFGDVCVVPADYRGDPNPHEPGEEEWAVPGGRSSCGGGVAWARSTSDGWLSGVYPFSGEVHFDVVDMVIPGRGFDFVWARRYRSQLGQTTKVGNGWDYSYNISVRASGPDLVLRNGMGREDTYTLQSPGVWTNGEFFRQIELQVDGRLEVHFANGGRWVLKALNGAPAEGMIEAIIDRNSNTMTFVYDVQGRPVQAIDTLGHQILFNWWLDRPLIHSIQDHTGRQVVYDYYVNADVGGSDLDLRSVRSPVVTGTPNGNDYPAGKTTTYTYTEGFADDRLNHNLLTVTDAKGQTWLRNNYAATTNPMALEFDSIESQVWGNGAMLLGNGLADLGLMFRATIAPSPSNNFADIVAVVNDRVGHVKEIYFDSLNRAVMVREYTGSAVPGVQTTLVANRPTGKLRATDPDYFETGWNYNTAGLVVRVLFPNLNETQYEYDELNPIRTANGNLLTRRRLPGPLGGDQPQQVETFTYLSGFGSCCGTNFVETYTDARGHTVSHMYDGSGNRTQTLERVAGVQHNWEYNAFGQMTAHVLPNNGTGHRRRDEFIYYAAGPQTGYLQSKIVDAANLALTTTHEYNARGAMIARTDPRGAREEFIRNQLDQVVRHLKRPVFTGATTATIVNAFYFDANDNLVRIGLSNQIDQLGNDLPVPCNEGSSLYDVDILNRVVRVCREKNSVCLANSQLTCAGLVGPDFITEEYEYDANGNRIRHHSGEAVIGAQPMNTTDALWDERDMLYRTIRAAGDPAQAVTQYDYDKNGNLELENGGLDIAAPRITQYEYDGYNRRIASTDAMGNVKTWHYDANGNVSSERLDGELTDVPGGASNVRLSETTFNYDFMDRRTQTSVARFNLATQAPIGDGATNTIIVYNGHAGILSITNDVGNATTYVYDTANRVGLRTDAKNNTIAYSYDANSNVTTTLETEKSDVGGPDQAFTTTSTYDGLDRLRTTTDNSGNTTEYRYDARDNRILTIDPLLRQTRQFFDMQDRLLRTVRDMNGDGASLTAVPGDGNPDIVTAQVWDDNRRMTSQTDDNANTTTYAYDALDRRSATTYADCTTEQAMFDVHGNAVWTTDANGTMVTSQYDRNDRLIQSSIAPGPGVDGGTTFETRQYNGLGSMVSAQDDDSLVTRAHSSTGRVVRETLNGLNTLYSYAENDRRSTLTAPGGRVTAYTYDALERPDVISEPGFGTIADYAYIGPGRVERRDYGNGTRTTYVYDGVTGTANPPGDFGVKQIINTRHSVIATNANIDVRTYTYDQVGNKLARRDTRTAGPQYRHLYSYDAANRLTRTQVLNPANTVLRDENYALDGVSNRTSITGGLDPGAYAMLGDACMPPADQDVNQYTTTSFDARTYDANGSLASINFAQPTQRLFKYDYRNRLVEHTSAGGVVSRYTYDALGRRIEKVVDVNGPAVTTRFYYDGPMVIEERDGVGATTATYVSSPGSAGANDLVDLTALLIMRRGGVNYYYHEDDAGNIMALTNTTGVVSERYEYGDFGLPLSPTTLAAVSNQTVVSNPYTFGTTRFDTETALYQSGCSAFEPRAGRWMSNGRPRSQFGATGIMMDGKLHWRPPGRLRSASTPSLAMLRSQGAMAGMSPFLPWQCTTGACGQSSSIYSFDYPTLRERLEDMNIDPDDWVNLGLVNGPSMGHDVGSGFMYVDSDMLINKLNQDIANMIAQEMYANGGGAVLIIIGAFLLESAVDYYIMPGVWARVSDSASTVTKAMKEQWDKTQVEQGDTDGDGMVDHIDPDDDNDGKPDEKDSDPKDPSKSITHESEGGIPMLQDRWQHSIQNAGVFEVQVYQYELQPMQLPYR